MERKLFTAAEIARMTGWSLSFVYKLCGDGRLPAIKVGRTVRVRPEDLEAVLRDNTRPNVPERVSA